MPIIAGLDGCRGGWICLTKDLDTNIITPHIFPSICGLLALEPRPIAAMVDMPIGLPNAGFRKCDQLARQRLGRPRASSVFPAPIRPTLQAGNYADACDIGARIDNGRRLTRQAWSILPKIKQVDDLLKTDVTLRNWIREVHPEVCFSAMNEGYAMAHNKKSECGHEERYALIRRSICDETYQAVRAALPRNRYQPDDLLDAFAALWSAERFVNSIAWLLPEDRFEDSCGLPMQIIA